MLSPWRYWLYEVRDAEAYDSIIELNYLLLYFPQMFRIDMYPTGVHNDAPL